MLQAPKKNFIWPLSMMDSAWRSPVSSPARTEVIIWKWLKRAAGETVLWVRCLLCAHGELSSAFQSLRVERPTLSDLLQLSFLQSQSVLAPHLRTPPGMGIATEPDFCSLDPPHRLPEVWLMASLVMQGCIFNFPASEFYPGSALISSCKEIVACSKAGRRSLMLPVQAPFHTAILVFPEPAFACFPSGSKFISVILKSS